MYNLMAILALPLLVLSGCEGLSNPDGTGSTGPAETGSLPNASGGLRGALESGCGVEVLDPDELIKILNARLGQDAARTARKFCELAATQYPVGATGVAQSLRVILPDGQAATVTRTPS